jgi:hypothetical protein
LRFIVIERAHWLDLPARVVASHKAHQVQSLIIKILAEYYIKFTVLGLTDDCPGRVLVDQPFMHIS